jgi:cell division protein FtsZ
MAKNKTKNKKFKKLKKKKASKPVRKPARHTKKPRKILITKNKFVVRHKKRGAKKKIKLKVKIKPRKIHKIKKPEVKKEPVSAFRAENLFKAKIKVIGIGGGGGSIVSEIGKSLEKATFVVADTDARSLKKKTDIKYFLFGQEKTHGLGTGGNPEIARETAEDSKEKIEKLFFDQDIVILISSLGGGLGSGATEIFAKLAMASGAITLGIFTLPFKFEGKSKSRIALKHLRELRSLLNVSITIPNEKIFKIIDVNTPITQAFSVVNKNLIESLESLIDLIYNPGLINIDFADLRTILKGKGSLAFLNTAEESGKDRAEKICQKILINPLYQNNNFTAEKILFNVSGPADLKMHEVEKISRTISELNPKARVIFGISRGKSKSKIKTTILMTGPGSKFQKITEVLPAETKTALKEEPKKTKPEKILKIKKEEFKKPEKLRDIPAENLIPAPILSQSIKIEEKPVKKIIRRNALEIKKAEELQESKKIAQEEEWEIPAFLRRVKFKS